MTKWHYSKGLHDLGNGCFAWLQPDGGWGWSNAGLVTDGLESLLIDTLFDLSLTAEMLAGMRAASRQGGRPAGQHPFQRRPPVRQPVAGRRRDHRLARLCRGDEGAAGRGTRGPAAQLAAVRAGRRLSARGDGQLKAKAAAHGARARAHAHGHSYGHAH
ncbi:hypothetical protein [Reyranella sp.]|uniref:hypothetical protein n=1 Tax=Reyranella sp. TaxID=1929291 RepID=UPI003784F30C